MPIVPDKRPKPTLPTVSMALVQGPMRNPAAVPCYDKMPQELRALRIWVAWRAEKRKDKKTGEWKETKVPYNTRTGRPAKTNDPTTWGSFEEAKKAFDRGGYDGIGVVLVKPYAGADLDGCCPKEGVIEKWAADILNELKTYAEWSVSCQGIHALTKVKGGLPKGRRQFDLKDRAHHGLGLYDSERGRFFCMTGNTLSGATIAERTSELARIHERFSLQKEKDEQPKPKAETYTSQPQPDDDDLIARGPKSQ